jgi:hypothetical protein
VHGFCPVALTEESLYFRRVLYRLEPSLAVDMLQDKGNIERQCLSIIMSKLPLHPEVHQIFMPNDTSLMRLDLQQDGAKLTLLTENDRKLPKSLFNSFRKDVTAALILAELISERCYFYNHIAPAMAMTAPSSSSSSSSSTSSSPSLMCVSSLASAYASMHLPHPVAPSAPIDNNNNNVDNNNNHRRFFRVPVPPPQRQPHEIAKSTPSGRRRSRRLMVVRP